MHEGRRGTCSRRSVGQSVSQVHGIRNMPSLPLMSRASRRTLGSPLRYAESGVAALSRIQICGGEGQQNRRETVCGALLERPWASTKRCATLTATDSDNLNRKTCKLHHHGPSSCFFLGTWVAYAFLSTGSRAPTHNYPLSLAASAISTMSLGRRRVGEWVEWFDHDEHALRIFLGLPPLKRAMVCPVHTLGDRPSAISSPAERFLGPWMKFPQVHAWPQSFARKGKRKKTFLGSRKFRGLLLPWQ